MFHLKKKIWLLFYFILFIGTSLLISAVYLKKEGLLNEIKSDQLYLSKVFNNHLNSQLIQNETILDLISSEYLQNPNFNRQTLSSVLTQNPLTANIAVFSKDGELLHSGFSSEEKIDNLLKNRETKKWFKDALNSSGMIIGKVYFAENLNKWIMPIRKRIIDKEGNIIALISAAIDIKKLQLQWQNKDNSENIVQATLSNGAYPIFRSNLKENNYQHYYNNVMGSSIRLGQDLVKLKKQLTNQQSNKFIQSIGSSDSGKFLYTLGYNKRYDFWVSADLPYQQIIQRLYSHSIFYAVFYLLLVIIVFSLFRWIIKIEDSKLEELTYKAEHDELTGLPNRTIIPKQFSDLQKEGETPFALLYLDLDNFKSINDSFGHSYGDLILIEVTERIKKVISKYQGIASRYSGDEFVIFIESGNKEEITEFATLLLENISLPYLINQNAFKISSSIGIARFPVDANNIETLLSYADNSMNVAKKKKNQHRFFSHEIHHQLLRSIEIEQALHQAIINKEISLVYQPQLDREQKLFGIEALVRWNSKQLGFVPPDQFIPIAEESGLMPKLGLYIMSKAMQEIATLRLPEELTFNLSINVSVRQFIQLDFIDKLMQACGKFNRAKIAITIEITESLFIESLDSLLPIFHKMKANYISLSLDDFGTGYSSLSMLRNVPIDELKIDKSFVDHIVENKSDRAMVKSIISMGKNLGLTVLAEGVEDKEQVAILQQAGCDVFQGYYFSKPLALNDLQEFIYTHDTSSMKNQ